MTEEFKKIIDVDIAKTEEELQNGNKESRFRLFKALISKYGNIIDGFDEELHSLFYDESGKYCVLNLEILRQKLVLFKALNYKNCYSKNENTEITVNIYNHFLFLTLQYLPTKNNP